MENKICNTLLDMMGDWHDISIKVEQCIGGDYFRIIIDHTFNYCILNDIEFASHFDEALEMIVYLYEHDIKSNTIRSRKSLKKG